jgi:hypothetical protein
MKKLLLVVATAVGASIVKKNLDRSKSDKDLWRRGLGAIGSAPALQAGSHNFILPVSGT